jgi:putative flippase GtrA
MPAEIHTEKVPLFRSFRRSQITSVLATSVDFSLTIFLTEFLHLLYKYSTAVGAFCGAVTSFLLCRHWAFQRKSERWERQAGRYVVASGLSLLLNTWSVIFLTETFDIQYVVSKIIAAVFWGLTVNFLLFRYFVFR